MVAVHAQKDFKACGQSWMSGYCKKTCGACSGGSPTSLQASSSPSNSPSWYSTYSSPRLGCDRELAQQGQQLPQQLAQLVLNLQQPSLG